MRFRHTDLDPRAKLAFALAVAIVTIVVPTIRSLVLLAGLLVAVIALGRGYGGRDLLRSLAPLKVLIPIILVLNAVFYSGGTILWSVELLSISLSVTTGGLETSAVIAGRLLILAGLAGWFATTTESETFEVALVRLGIPWSIAFMSSLSLRLVPEMRTRFRRIEEAQRSRGLTFEGGPLARAKQRLPMLIPFLVSVIRYGQDLGDALQVRDFGRVRRRTFSVSVGFGPGDYAFTAFAVAILIAFLFGFRP